LGDYLKKIPEPGRGIIREERVVERTIERHEASPIDIAALANAVAQAININIQAKGGSASNGFVEDSFDNSKTMAKIAEQMIIQRGDNETNFDGLGKTKEVHKNSEETDRTIDLLSGLD